MLTQALFRTLVEFASAASGLPDPGGVPEVRFVSQCEMNKLIQGVPLRAPGCGAESKIQPLALYFDGPEVVYLLSECRAFETAACWVIFAHEATHWLQDHAGQMDPDRTWCISDRIEPPAYAVHNAAAVVLGQWELLRDPGFVALVSSCDRR